MGSSMTSPKTFQHRNNQRHYQQYLRKHRTQKSQDTKIRFKGMSQFTISNKRLNSQQKDIRSQYEIKTHNFISPDMKRQKNQITDQNVNLLNTKKTQNTKLLEKPENTNQNIQIIQQYQFPKKNLNHTTLQQSSVLNSLVKNSSMKKITINDQTYNIDIQKIKNRRLKTKQRFNQSILLSNVRNGSYFNGFSMKPQTNMSSNLNGISSLELQSHLNSNLQSNVQNSLNQNPYKSEDVLKSMQNSQNSVQRILQKQDSKPTVQSKHKNHHNPKNQLIQIPYNNAPTKQSTSLTKVKSQPQLIKIKKLPQTQKTIVPQNQQIRKQYYQQPFILQKHKKIYQKVQAKQKKVMFGYKQTFNQDQKLKEIQFLKNSQSRNQNLRSTKNNNKNGNKELFASNDEFLDYNRNTNSNKIKGHQYTTLINDYQNTSSKKDIKNSIKVTKVTKKQKPTNVYF